MQVLDDFGEDDEPDVHDNAVSVCVVGSNECVQTSQLTATLPEVLAMQKMPGGLCLTNWLRIRGLLNEPFMES